MNKNERLSPGRAIFSTDVVFLDAVAVYLAFNHVDDVFGNICGMIGDPFELAAG